MANPSRAALLDFLDYLSNKGLINRTTAAARKAAANKVLEILDESEAADISKVDIDEVMGRFANLQGGKYTPESLTSYKSRLKSAVDDFLRYQKDPMSFKPSVQNAGRRAERARVPGGDGPPRHEQQPTGTAEAPPASVDIIPIPLRPDLTIKIQGLPFDLTMSEANKISNVVKALATGD